MTLCHSVPEKVVISGERPQVHQSARHHRIVQVIEAASGIIRGCRNSCQLAFQLIYSSFTWTRNYYHCLNEDGLSPTDGRMALRASSFLRRQKKQNSIYFLPFCVFWESNNHVPRLRGRISSVGRALDCRAGGRGFDSRGRTITQGLKMTEKWRYFLCTASGETFAWLGWPRKMAVPSPLGDVKYSVPN